jgi:hypothetical protein
MSGRQKSPHFCTIRTTAALKKKVLKVYTIGGGFGQPHEAKGVAELEVAETTPKPPSKPPQIFFFSSFFLFFFEFFF